MNEWRVLEPMLKHYDEDGNPHIDFFRNQVNECIMTDANDKTLDEQRGAGHPDCARASCMIVLHCHKFVNGQASFNERGDRG